MPVSSRTSLMATPPGGGLRTLQEESLTEEQMLGLGLVRNGAPPSPHNNRRGSATSSASYSDVEGVPATTTTAATPRASSEDVREGDVGAGHVYWSEEGDSDDDLFGGEVNSIMSRKRSDSLRRPPAIDMRSVHESGGLQVSTNTESSNTTGSNHSPISIIETPPSESHDYVSGPALDDTKPTLDDTDEGVNGGKGVNESAVSKPNPFLRSSSDRNVRSGRRSSSALLSGAEMRQAHTTTQERQRKQRRQSVCVSTNTNLLAASPSSHSRQTTPSHSPEPPGRRATSSLSHTPARRGSLYSSTGGSPRSSPRPRRGSVAVDYKPVTDLEAERAAEAARITRENLVKWHEEQNFRLTEIKRLRILNAEKARQRAIEAERQKEIEAAEAERRRHLERLLVLKRLAHAAKAEVQRRADAAQRESILEREREIRRQELIQREQFDRERRLLREAMRKEQREREKRHAEFVRARVERQREFRRRQLIRQREVALARERTDAERKEKEEREALLLAESVRQYGIMLEAATQNYERDFHESQEKARRDRVHALERYMSYKKELKPTVETRRRALQHQRNTLRLKGEKVAVGRSAWDMADAEDQERARVQALTSTKEIISVSKEALVPPSRQSGAAWVSESVSGSEQGVSASESVGESVHDYSSDGLYEYGHLSGDGESGGSGGSEHLSGKGVNASGGHHRHHHVEFDGVVDESGASIPPPTTTTTTTTVTAAAATTTTATDVSMPNGQQHRNHSHSPHSYSDDGYEDEFAAVDSGSRGEHAYRTPTRASGRSSRTQRTTASPSARSHLRSHSASVRSAPRTSGGSGVSGVERSVGESKRVRSGVRRRAFSDRKGERGSQYATRQGHWDTPGSGGGGGGGFSMAENGESHTPERGSSGSVVRYVVINHNGELTHKQRPASAGGALGRPDRSPTTPGSGRKTRVKRVIVERRKVRRTPSPPQAARSSVANADVGGESSESEEIEIGYTVSNRSRVATPLVGRLSRSTTPHRVLSLGSSVSPHKPDSPSRGSRSSPRKRRHESPFPEPTPTYPRRHKSVA